MKHPVILIEALLDRVESYSRLSYELAKLKSVETTAQGVTMLIAGMSVIIMIVLFVLILNIGIALLLGELLGKMYYGFFIVSGFYLVAAIVFHFFLHEWIKKPVSNSLISHTLD